MDRARETFGVGGGDPSPAGRGVKRLPPVRDNQEKTRANMARPTLSAMLRR